MDRLQRIEEDLARGPRGGEPEVGVDQYQALLGVEDAYWLVKRLRLASAVVEAAEKARERGPVLVGILEPIAKALDAWRKGTK